MLPDRDALEHGLGVLLHRDRRQAVEILDRRVHSEASTFPIEVVTCRIATGERLELLCKYSANREHDGHGHRGGVVYEASVYRDVLRGCGLSVPRFRGSYEDPTSGWTWLVMDYLEGALTADSPTGVVRAAEWIGRFHAAWDGSAEGPVALPLRVYERTYYQGWARRTVDFVGPHIGELPWLPALSERFGEIAAALLESPQTVIHGEYYPLNVLVDDRNVYPVDWEAAAIGPGEIDLASLTQSWPPEIVDRCEMVYGATRWPGGAPAGFEKTLEVARLYWLFRWLGEDRRRTEKRLKRRIDKLRNAARHWGIIPGEAA
jgi:hypothetical protein